jgi:hypothetical protein
MRKQKEQDDGYWELFPAYCSQEGAVEMAVGGLSKEHQGKTCSIGEWKVKGYRK